MINLSLNVYHKPAHSFSYVHYRSSHLQHTKINIVLSLEQQRIICLVSENKEQYLNKLRSYIIQHGLPKEVQYYTIIKLFSPSWQSQDESTDYIAVVQTYNPSTRFNKNINNILNNFYNNSLKNAFGNKKPLLGTRQVKSLQNILVRPWENDFVFSDHANILTHQFFMHQVRYFYD